MAETPASKSNPEREALSTVWGTFEAISDWAKPAAGTPNYPEGDYAQRHIRHMCVDAREIIEAALRGEDVWAVVEAINERNKPKAG